VSYSKDTQQVFDDWARRGRAEGMERGHKTRAIQALEKMPIAGGDRLLDLGCGNGWATRWLIERAGEGGSASGIDVAAEMLERARSQSEGIPGITFVAAAFDDLPWAGPSFDHAFSMEALYYAPDLGAALRSVAAVLRRGGTLTSCIDFFEENPYSASWPAMLDIEMKRLSERGWVEAFEAAGLRVEACFRCYDPRPAEPAASEQEQRETLDFRRNIGSLAIRGRVPEGDEGA
jgi:ubiquinone/menaquinone biosynthesis C-methylase UbiE